MNDSPGWASPGSSPSEEPDRGGSEDQVPGGTPPGQDGAPRSGQDGAPPNWSKEQPPPGQWSAPAGRGSGAPAPPAGWQQPPPGPGSGPGPGWGAPGGWQQPAWGRPASPKPGVIPLRPLGVGEILDGAVSTMRAHWRTVLGVAFVVALVSEAASVLLQGFAVFGDTSLNSTAGASPQAALDSMLDTADSILATGTAALVITVVGVVTATAVLTMVTSRAVLGRPVTTKEAWADARPQLLRLFGLNGMFLLLWVGVFAGCLLPGVVVAFTGPSSAAAVLIVLGILAAGVLLAWLMIRFCLSSPALMLEKQGVIKAMKRSARLVRGSWWRICGIQLLTSILVYIVASIIQVPFLIIGAISSAAGMSSLTSGGTPGWAFLVITGIGGVIGSTITFPINAGVTALLYMDQRIRREALDLELARAAGVPGFETMVPAGAAPGTPGAAPATGGPTGTGAPGVPASPGDGDGTAGG